MIFKPIQEIIDWITPQEVGIVKMETSSEQQSDIRERFLAQQLKMGTKYIFHPKNRVKRLDGKVYSSTDVDNVRPMRKSKVAA